MSGDRRWYRFVRALRLPAWVWVAASLAVPHQILGQTRVGSEFQVNSYTSSSQDGSAVAFDGAGGFVVVWHSILQDGNGRGVFGQRFSSTGAALGEEFQVNEYTSGSQWRASVAADAEGDFVVAWQSVGGQDGSGTGVFARRYSSAGTGIGGEFQVNTFTPLAQGVPAVAANADGAFVVVWWDTNNFDLFAQRFSSAGDPVGGEFQVNTFTDSDQRYPSVAMGSGGGFVVSWESYDQDDSDFGVFVQRFSSDGEPLGGELQVNTYTDDVQGNSAVAVHADGGFVVTWSSYGQDGYGYGVFVRRFSSTGVAVSDELQVNTYTEGGATRPALAATTDGGSIVAWTAYGDVNGDGIFARRYSSDGLPLADEFQVNSYTDYPSEPSIASDDSGGFVVAWDGYGRADEFDVFAQRFGSGAPSEVELDVDGDGQTDALTDGILILRRFFGFTGATLTDGVDTEGCSRCDAEDIEPYIAGLGLVLDIDGDGALGPLTDGLLVVRYLFDFTGTTLTNGAVNTGGCSRCNAAAIEPYLLGLDS